MDRRSCAAIRGTVMLEENNVAWIDEEELEVDAYAVTPLSSSSSLLLSSLELSDTKVYEP